MKKKNILTGALLLFLIGSFLYDFFRDDRLFGTLFCSLAVLLVPRIPLKAALFWVGAFSAGLLRVFFSLSAPEVQDISFYARNKETASVYEMVGTVASYPKMKEQKVQIALQGEEFFSHDRSRKVIGKILVNLPRYPEVFYGDRLRVRGLLEIPPEDGEFSYRRYLEKEGVYAMISRAEFEVIGKEQGRSLFRTLFSLRRWMEKVLREKIPEPEASFAIGILLGGEDGFPEETIREFQKTGLSHLLALSGFNITILILAVFWIFRFFPKYMTLFFTLVVIAAFVIMTGASASVMRAAVMGLLGLFVLHFGEEGHPLQMLLWSVFLITLMNPFLLLSDVSFQLSLAGVLGLVFFTPLWQKWFEKIPEFMGLKDGLQTTLAAQIMTVPLIIFHFERLSLISPIANIFVAPLIPFAMLTSFLTLLPLFGNVFAFLSYGILKLALALVSLFAAFPFADTAVHIDALSFILLYLFFAFLYGGTRIYSARFSLQKI